MLLVQVDNNTQWFLQQIATHHTNAEDFVFYHLPAHRPTDLELKATSDALNDPYST